MTPENTAGARLGRVLVVGGFGAAGRVAARALVGRAGEVVAAGRGAAGGAGGAARRR